MTPSFRTFISAIVIILCALPSCFAFAQTAKPKKKPVGQMPTELTVEIPQTLSSAQQQFSLSSGSAEAQKIPFLQSVSFSLSNLVAEEITVRGSTPKLFSFSTKHPNAEIRFNSRPLFQGSRVFLKTFFGIGFASLARESNVVLPTGNIRDSQFLYIGQVELGATILAIPFSGLSQLKVGVEALAAPSLSFSTRSLSSDGKTYRALGGQAATFLFYDFSSRVGISLKTGYRFSNLSLENDNGFGYALSLENRF
jgi:hypothetical protein